jgi:uncharacterized membrane protein YfcA
MNVIELNSLLFLGLMALSAGFIKGGMPMLGPLVASAIALWFPSRDALGLTLVLFLMLGLAIGVMVLVLVAMEPLRPALSRWALANPQTARGTSGLLAGIATTISNSSGPILSIYFLVLNLDKRSFIGTASIFFAFANVAKVPIFLNQGVFQVKYFLSLLLVVPLVYLGAFFGKRFFEWISQLWFNRVVLVFTAVAGVLLIINNWPAG